MTRDRRRHAVIGIVMAVTMAIALTDCGQSSSSAPTTVKAAASTTTTAATQSTTKTTSASSAAGINLASPGANSGCPSSACTDVLSLVSAAPKITKLPSDLQPSLLNAQNDLLRPTDAKCLPVQQIHSGTACTYDYSSNPSAPMMVLMGDSHAWMWATSVAQVALRTGYNFTMIYHSSCRMPLIAFANSPGTTNAQCVQWKQSAFSWISQENPSLVVVATQDASPIDPQGNVISQSTYNAGLVAMLKKVAAPDRRVVLLGDIPVLSQDGPTCLAANESSVQNCSTPTSEAVRNSTQEGQSAAAAQAGASYIYTIPWLCTTSVCPAVIGNYEVYEDRYHITSTYGSFLANVLQSALGAVG